MAHRLRLAAVVALLVTSSDLAAQSAAQGRQSSLMAEFPPYDAVVVSWLQPGLASKRADRLLREDPLGIETVQALVSARREEDALRAARRIFDAQPQRIARTLAVLSTFVPPAREVPGRKERLQAMLAHARSRLPALARADRAEAAYAIVGAESSLVGRYASSDDAYVSDLRTLAAEYVGTPTALEVEVDLAARAFYESRGDGIRRHDDMLAFARAHPGTTAGARALYLAGSHVANNADLIGLASRGGGGDPTDRILRVMDVVRELESGRYPRCDWTERAHALVTGLYADRPSYSPENVDKLLAAYASFVVEHWELADQVDPAEFDIGYLATTRVAELYKLKGDAIGGLDRFLANLEGKVPDRFAVRYLLAMHYLKAANSRGEAASKAALLDKAERLLDSIHQQADGPYKRKALATLASRAFYARDWPKARLAFEHYVREFPESTYAWVAAIRIGKCQERMDDWRAALASYQNVNGKDESAPAAGVLADVFAGRAHEAAGDFATAFTLFRRAADRWDPAFGETYDITSFHVPLPGESPFRDAGADTRVARAELGKRIGELQRTMAAPGGANLERARWLLGMKRWQEAARAAARTASEFATSPNAAEARFVNHCARLQEALERADVESRGADPAAAMTILDGLASEPFDFAIAVANIARAYMASGSARAPQAEQRLLDNLAKLVSAQPPVRTLSGLEQDVADIRSLAFRPNGDAIFAGTRWNGFAWPQTPSAFVVAALEVPVILADGQVSRLSFPQRFPHLDNVLFVDERHIELLGALMNRLGGRKTREARLFADKGIMEAPNQPVGPSLSVMAFLNKGFRVIPGHWGGWCFDTFPTIDEVVFIDGARTRAVARVTVGYGGGDVLLEKREGVWRATRVVHTWVT